MTVLQVNYVQGMHACIYIMIELVRHACMVMNLTIHVRCIITFTVHTIGEILMIACMQ